MSFRSGLRPSKRAIAHAVEQLWRLSFGAVAYVLRPDAKRLTPTGSDRVLIVAPHPDDEAMGCVGTVLLHVRSGDRVCLAVVTDGRQSKVIADPARMALQRYRESCNAARLMQVDRLEMIGLPEGEWSVSQLQGTLRTLIEAIDPGVIYAPSRIDFHPEHFKVAHALALALGELSASRTNDIRVRVYQVQVPLSPLLSNVVTDVSAVLSDYEAVLRVYESQAGSIQCAYRHRRYSAALHRIAGRAEEFWELSAQRYAAVHAQSPAHWSRIFRGLRAFPLSDPLAYLVGIKERRRIRAMGSEWP
jgi:LmbE family N-acetylglucosaminyl deacetylase